MNDPCTERRIDLATQRIITLLIDRRQTQYVPFQNDQWASAVDKILIPVLLNPRLLIYFSRVYSRHRPLDRKWIDWFFIKRSSLGALYEWTWGARLSALAFSDQQSDALSEEQSIAETFLRHQIKLEKRMDNKFI